MRKTGSAFSDRFHWLYPDNIGGQAKHLDWCKSHAKAFTSPSFEPHDCIRWCTVCASTGLREFEAEAEAVSLIPFQSPYAIKTDVHLMVILNLFSF